MNDPGHPHARPSRLLELALWGAAGVLVLSVHIGAASWLMREPEMAASDGAPPAAIMIELAPEPVAEKVEENVETPDTIENEQVKSETVEPVEEPEAEPPPPEPVVEEMPPEEPVVEETPPPEPVQDMAETVPEEIPEELPEPVEPVEQELAELEDVEVPLPVVRPPPEPEKKVEEKKPPEKKVVRKPEPKKQPQAQELKQAAQSQVTQADKTAAPRTAASAGSSSVSPARWQSRVMAHLERRKKYPGESRSKREQGTAYVRFQIDGEGNVLAVSLSRSSGFAALDQEVLAMVRRASPVPAPPPGVNKTIVAPVMFTIR